MGVTTTLFDHLKASSAHPPLRNSHLFLLQQLSQVSQSSVFFDADRQIAFAGPNYAQLG
jgi:hypothetical protein